MGRLAQAGAFSVVYGSAGGLTATGGLLFTQGAGSVEVVDQFDAQLATGDFNNINNRGSSTSPLPPQRRPPEPPSPPVSVLYGGGGGLGAHGGQLFTQNSPGVPGTAEAFDRFGGID